jgi:nicotinamide-nucleotide amidase
MNEVNASIITIGDELLIGQTIDTNSAFIAQELNKIGVWVKRRVAIADDKAAILKTLADEAQESNIIIITGGLGPTADDITKPTLCDYFNTRLVVDEGALQNVTEIFRKLGRPMIERNAKQAEVPESCIVLPNLRGTAPGMWFEAPPPPKGGVSGAQGQLFGETAQDTTTSESGVGALAGPPLGDGEAGRVVYVSLPGVPHEMKGLMSSSVIPKLKETFTLPAVVHRTLLTAGQGESFIAERLSDFEAALPSSIKIAYLPAYGMVRLRLTGRGTDEAAVKKEIENAFEQLKTLVQEWRVADEDVSLPEAVRQLLKEKKKTIATAESCTGGYIAHLITSLPGSSVIYNGTVVSYANEVKQNVLNVKEETLKRYGAVSEQTVSQMAAGVCTLLKTDYAVATSGIMGPDGGTEEKPVGTVWIAVANNKGKIRAQKSHFRFDRGRNIELTANAALMLLRRFVLEDLND